MKLTIRQVRLVGQICRWTMVVCLSAVLSVSPAMAGWMLENLGRGHKASCLPARPAKAAACQVAPACPPPATVMACPPVAVPTCCPAPTPECAVTIQCCPAPMMPTTGMDSAVLQSETAPMATAESWLPMETAPMDSYSEPPMINNAAQQWEESPSPAETEPAQPAPEMTAPADPEPSADAAATDPAPLDAMPEETPADSDAEMS